MSILHRLNTIRAMPVGVVASKLTQMLARQAKNRLIGAMMRNHCTYPPSYGMVPLSRRLPALSLSDADGNLRRRALAAASHSFDLLGSGPVRVVHPLAKYPQWREGVSGAHHRGNRKRAASLLSMIDTASYVPVDWHVDFRSGYRWPIKVWGGATAYGHKAGVDVKVPWELGRLQHLPQLALAYAAGPDQNLATEFHDQVLDFLAANPPGWGVQWACAMDVSIRAANLVLAWELFVAHGATFSLKFEEELAAALVAHGRHVARNLEWSPDHRGNHYLADIAGLAFVACALPRGEETDLWLVFCAQQLDVEIRRQFLEDGGNFEASTAYHRLSLEMALFAVALILGLDDDRKSVFAHYDASLWGLTPGLRPGPMAWPPFAPQTLERLALALGFAQTVTKPGGDIVQVGDNDSGRFFVLDTDRSPLDVSHLWAGPITGQMLAALSGGALPLAPRPAPMATIKGGEGFPASFRRLRLVPGDPRALDGLQAFALPQFGLYGWRNDRAFISVRCGRLMDGRGAHAHNDQLAVEIQIDGVDWVRDPGTFAYTGDLAARNAYRSVLAHFVPRQGQAEPAALNLGPFRLDDTARAEVLAFDGLGFVGRHHGFGPPVWRRIRIETDGVVIDDSGLDQGGEIRIDDPAALASLLGQGVRFSPGYGLQE
ncbi:MAG: heparinase II/III family protein [Magnetospirillum gryphiswaldense]|nr:heparinase II/III family protein [Magnetospirillum gryphiswaldense]